MNNEFEQERIGTMLASLSKFSCEERCAVQVRNVIDKRGVTRFQLDLLESYYRVDRQGLVDQLREIVLPVAQAKILSMEFMIPDAVTYRDRHGAILVPRLVSEKPKVYRCFTNLHSLDYFLVVFHPVGNYNPWLESMK